ncbi:growth factor receptor-bound protein 7 [Gadus morhua]|uniref:Growth factor receptor bound protein 7 n=1 Tax=Gadus morhua TaxID=8049 RepID=A0A8C4Z6Q1_GADMO|nr:growth factor receptor-bound protein 7-like [Gadus morhua]
MLMVQTTTGDMTAVAGPWEELMEGEDDSYLSGSTMTLDLLDDEPPALRHLEPRHLTHSQPITISPARVKADEGRWSSSLPTIPNPFPELCSPPQSPVVIGSVPPSASDKHLIRVFGEDSYSRSLWVSRGATAKEVCHLLVQTAHCSDQESWALIEFHPSRGLERCLEDHEMVLQVQTSWSIKADAKLLFRKNYAKYEFFRTPALFFPEAMISDSADASHGIKSSELIETLLRSGSCPEIQGFLQVKEPSRRAWKRVYFLLRRSGLYSSTKGSSKEPRHLQCVADLGQLSVFQVVNGRRLYGAPSNYTFCIKPAREPVHTRGLKLLCAETEEARTCWTSAFRLFKYGKQLHSNFQFSKSAAQWSNDRTETRLRGSDASLVAMDFSGSAGRVISASEAKSVEREEGQSWRRREALLGNLAGRAPGLRPDSGAPGAGGARGAGGTKGTSASQGARPSSIHRGHPWFHGGVSRREAERLVEEQGLVDGMFLIRDSQQQALCFVLSLCHKLKTKHYLVIPCEEGGRQYYSMDDGVTVFADLLQLVEFHQINRGILPVCLKHPCVGVAL